MSDNLVQFESDAGVAKVTLNRPDHANALNLEMTKALWKIATTCDEDKSIRAVHLTGAGRMFSAGGDLRAFASEGSAIGVALKEMTTYLHGALARFARMRAPLVIAVNGAAAGAGFSIALSGDLVFAANSASFTMAYTAAGLTPDGSSTYLLPRIVGARRARELILMNRRLSAEEALQWGVVNRVIADEQLLEASMAAARQLAEGPTSAYGAAKALLQASANNGYETQMELEARAIAAAAQSADGKEGIAAFLARRKPQFSGT
jgi:2-(1,2-epoxy-1,2-dihydrophenyl)acetyl-CoA isomerase